MPRRVQDIVPSRKRSIRDVAVEDESPRARTARKKPTKEQDKEVKLHKIADPEETEVFDRKARAAVAENASSNVTEHKPKKNRPKKNGPLAFVILGIVVVAAGVAFGASTYFSRATFEITPKVMPVAVNGTYTAMATPSKGILPYEIVTLKGSASTTVTAIDGPQLSSKAQGKIILYNSESATSQRLVAGTRLEETVGGSTRIYRLMSSVVVPGYTKKAGGVIPGTISTTIIADQPGEAYNISKADAVADMKLPAYKGSSKYSTIWARVAGDISGGFVGTKKTIPPATLATTTAELQARIRTDLLAKARTIVPEGYVSYDSAYVSSFGQPVISGKGARAAEVELSGSVSAIFFKRSELASRLAGEQSVASFGTGSYDAKGLDTLAVSILNTKDFSPEKRNALILKIKGDFSLTGVVPVADMKKRLSGLSLAETQAVIQSYSSVIKSGSGELVPPWSKVPSDLDRISIVIDEE